jgi:hypothetical protein
MRYTVTSEKAAQARGLRARRFPDQNRAPDANLDQARAPEEERAHYLPAERSLGDQERAQLLGIDQQRVQITNRDDIGERAPG